ncbi:MAG TPA: fatty acid desaturase family protein [Candidatus Binatia bacterium]|nr:fatty acid desaturase family protein [Candidatus Binatia bacterium]
MTAAWRDALAPEEVKALLAIDDARAWVSIGIDWALVAAAFALVARAPGPLTILVALLVIGGRQLGLAVLMHEAAHRTLLRRRRWNDLVGNWLCAYPVWGDLHAYRAYHLRHHAKTWTAEDPDLGLATPFPITGRSLGRKIWRDLSGQTGLKRAAATLRRERGRRADFMGTRNRYGVVITNAALLAVLTLAGHPALYLLWVGAWLTTYSLVMRIRSIAEHAMIGDPADPLRNTRTTLAAWWERLVLAPNRVNFHLEHHLLPTVPHYRLPRLHRLLRERGVLERACVTRGYVAVLRAAASAG